LKVGFYRGNEGCKTLQMRENRTIAQKTRQHGGGGPTRWPDCGGGCLVALLCYSCCFFQDLHEP